MKRSPTYNVPECGDKNFKLLKSKLKASPPTNHKHAVIRWLWVFLKSEKCGRGGKIERKKVEKGGKGRESAVFNEG